jgi:hypothetical protein
MVPLSFSIQILSGEQTLCSSEAPHGRNEERCSWSLRAISCVTAGARRLENAATVLRDGDVSDDDDETQMR